MPDTRERAQQELMLHLTLGVPLQATRSFSSPEVKATYTRARELCQQVGETRQLFPVLLGLRTFHQVRGEFLTARELGEQLLGLAQREQDPALLMEAYRALGSTLFHLGEFGAAQAHLEQGLTLYDSQRHHSHVFLYGMRAGGIWPLLCSLGPVASGLSGPGAPEERGSAYPGPRAVSSIQLGRRPGFCCHVSPAPPGKSTDPRVGRGRNHPRARARISSVVRARDYPAGLGAGRTGTE